MSETLYEIADRYREILSMDATTDDERAALVNALDEAGGDFRQKAENVCAYIRNCEAYADTIRAEEVRLANKRQALQKKAEKLTSYLEAMMFMTGQSDIRAGIFDLKIVKNPPSITVLNEAEVPQEYYIQQAPLLSKQAIKEAIKAGISVPGIEVVQNERLRIK